MSDPSPEPMDPNRFGVFIVDPLDPDRDPHGPNVRNAEVGSPLYQEWVGRTRTEED